MRFRDALSSCYKRGIKSSIYTLIIFVPLALYAIHPYWPANIFGWLIIVLFFVIFEVFYLAFLTYVESLRNEPSDFSLPKVLGWLVVIIPTSLVIIIYSMKLYDYVKEQFFVVRL